MLCIL